MNKTNTPEPDLDNILKRTLKDDLPVEAEARLKRQFFSLKDALARTERLQESDGWLWVRGSFRKDILALASAAMIIVGLIMQLGASQSALAHTIERLKVIVTISLGLNRVSFMDCAVMKSDAEGGQISYRVRWRAAGDVRVDMDSVDGAQTLWISNKTVSIINPGSDAVTSMPLDLMTPGPVWQPAMEFMSPKILGKNAEARYGLMQSSGRASVGMNEFLIIGREGQLDVEITVDANTYLPKVLKKYSHDSGRTNGARNCILEARFLWNQPTPGKVFSPQLPQPD